MIFLLTSSAYSQEIYISGTVINTLTGSPVENANIRVDNFNYGTTTDSSGKFKINICSQNQVLVISCVGYEPAIIKTGISTSNIVIKLFPARYLMKEVLVSSQNEKPEGFNHSLNKQQTDLLSGLSKDVLRSLQMLPGVVSNNEANSVVSVRGGSTDENLIMINGIEIHNPFHLREYFLTGTGIFNAGMVKKVDFSSGGFPARYGGALSSILNIEYEHGREDDFSSTADINMTGINLLLQGPVDKRSSFVLGFRKSFINRMLHLLSSYKDIPDISFYDIQSQIDYCISGNNKLRFIFILSNDDFHEYPHNDLYGLPGREIISGNIGDKYTSYREIYNSDFGSSLIFAGLTLKYFINERVYIESKFSLSKAAEKRNYNMSKCGSTQYTGYPELFRSSVEVDDLFSSMKNSCLSGVESISFYLSSFYNLLLGGEIKKSSYAVDKFMHGIISVKENMRSFPGTIEYELPPNPEYNDTICAVNTFLISDIFVENQFRMSGAINLNLGGRAGYSDINKEIYLSPRVSLNYKFIPGANINFTWGYYYQIPGIMQIEGSSSGIKNARAEHFILGAGKKFGNDFSVNSETYLKKYSNLIPAERISTGEIKYNFDGNYAKGFAYGIDVQLKYADSCFSFLLNYGYLKTKERANNSGTQYYNRYADQRHTISANVTYKNENFEVGLNLFFGSGLAYTSKETYFDPTNKMLVWIKGKINSSHLPPYLRADLNISSRFELFDQQLTLYFNLMNIFNRRNVYGYWYTYEGENCRPAAEALKLLPVVPSIGFRYEIN